MIKVRILINLILIYITFRRLIKYYLLKAIIKDFPYLA